MLERIKKALTSMNRKRFGRKVYRFVLVLVNLAAMVEFIVKIVFHFYGLHF